MSNTPERTEEEKKAANKRKGFGSNPGNINRSGRPKGSRNKSKLIKAQLAFDDYSTLAAERLKMIMMGDTEALGVKTITVAQMMKASSLILDKAISNEKDKEAQAKTKGARGGAKELSTPRVFTTAASS